MTRTIDVSDLPQPLVEAIETVVRTYRERSQESGTATPRPLGWAKGILPELPDSFFEPLPDDLLRLFEGEEE
ncbi:MAG: hypothetical protein K8T91_14775 [Planctomycetes bacterium]|nr:hypothetical protein [Planctomycetota bacterium]